MKSRILVIDDDANITSFLKRALSYEGYSVDTAANGSEGLARALEQPPDLVILDVMMPGLNGYEVAERLRSGGSQPILMLTARDAVPDRVAGLEAGADDYLVKPFAVPELIARIRALTRRRADPHGRLSYGELTLETGRRRASRGGRTIELTGREAALLELLLRAPEATLSRERAIEEIWAGAAEPNVVDRYVTRLRRKLGEPLVIHTVRGAGFTLRA